MALLLLAAVATAALLGVALAAAIILERRSRREADTATPDLAHIARWTAGWRWAGVALGLLLGGMAFLSAQRPVALGRLAMASPALAAGCILAGVAIGEATARPARTATRTATLGTRSWRSLLPRNRTIIVGGGLGILMSLLLVGTLTASPDDAGRPGRALTATCTVDIPGIGATVQTSTGSPWPGSFYALPAAIAVCACLALAIGGGVAVHRRANPSASTEVVDRLLRREAMANLVSATGVVAFGTAAPVALVMATVLHSNDCVHGGDTFSGILLVIALTCAVATVAMLGHLLLPRTRALRVVAEAAGGPARSAW